jgi:hypothetical protein
MIRTKISKAFATKGTALQSRNPKSLATEGTEITEAQIESSFIPLPRPRGRGEGEGAFPEKKS